MPAALPVTPDTTRSPLPLTDSAPPIVTLAAADAVQSTAVLATIFTKSPADNPNPLTISAVGVDTGIETGENDVAPETVSSVAPPATNIDVPPLG